MEQNVNPGLVLIGLSGTGPRRKNHKSNEVHSFLLRGLADVIL